MNGKFPIVIMNHGIFGKELVASAELIVGKIEDVQAISLLPGMSIEEFYGMAEEIVSSAEGTAILLTDLYGGTPCNVAMLLQQKYDVKVLCGLNLPMLLELDNFRGSCTDSDELVRNVLETAQAGVFQPSEMMDLEEE